MKSKVTPFRLWVTFFALWAIFLSGALAGFVGTPGAIQAIHLKSLLNEKQARLAEIQAGIDHLQSEASELERSKVVQRREIRRVLGYAAGDELIFDFNSPDSI
jgi:hypothetical protein